MFDVKKLAATTRPAVVLVTVLDKAAKPLGLATGFFVSPDGKLVTNAHVIEGADSASAKLENGATYSIRGVLKSAPDKDLVLLQADAKDVPSLTVNREPSLPEIGSRVAVIGSPHGFEGTVSEGIISGHSDAKKDDQWLQLTAPVSPGSSGSPVVDENSKVVGIATSRDDFDDAQALNFARPVTYVSELLEQSQARTEVAPFWTVSANPKNIVLNYRGKQYKNATVVRVEPDGLLISFSGGIVKIPFTELPKDVQDRYHYDPEKATAAQAAEVASIQQTNQHIEESDKQREEIKQQKALENQLSQLQLQEENLRVQTGRAANAPTMGLHSRAGASLEVQAYEESLSPQKKAWQLQQRQKQYEGAKQAAARRRLNANLVVPPRYGEAVYDPWSQIRGRQR